jgi:hypothetical protein
LPRSPAQRHAFLGPVHFDADAAAAVRAREVRCTCTRSPFCRGPLSRDWLDCSTTCRACKPAPWQPPINHGDPSTNHAESPD